MTITRNEIVTGINSSNSFILAIVQIDGETALPPVRYRGRVWVRVGPRRGIATVQAELKNNTNPPAEFDTSQTTFFLATVREAQI